VPPGNAKVKRARDGRILGSSVRLSTVALIVLVLAAGCGGSGGRHTTTSAPATGPRDRWGTVWLCRPGEASNPCLSDLTTTVVDRGGATHVERLSPAAKPPVDCFYVYPTVSGETTVNANRAIDFRLQEIATAQVSRFSQVCRVYAPVYRQITLTALDHPRRITLADALIAYRSVLAAFSDYLAHYNDGRGIVFIGHSQGAAILIRLLEQEFDRAPARRRQLVSALLLGGNATVAKGRTVGGDFAHIPACTSRSETGCVVAYSSFTTKPPANSQVGRTTSDLGVGLLAPRAPPANVRIMCVNPASPAGGTAPLDPAIPSLVLAFTGSSSLSVTTPWVAFHGQLTARCESSGDASWLQVTAVGRGAGGSLLRRLQDPALGLHVLDVNIALDDLVALVRDQAAAYLRRR